MRFWGMLILAAMGFAWSPQASAAPSNFDHMCHQGGTYDIFMNLDLPYLRGPVLITKNMPQVAAPNGYMIIFQNFRTPSRIFVAKKGLYIGAYDVGSCQIERGKCVLCTTDVSPPAFVNNRNQVIH